MLGQLIDLTVKKEAVEKMRDAMTWGYELRGTVKRGWPKFVKKRSQPLITRAHYKCCVSHVYDKAFIS